MLRPNILIITTDQQRWDALGANGNRDIQTPNLDWLAAEGLSFDHCFVQHPLCMPSRVSFLTGMYPASLGILQMGVPAPPETLTLARLLQSAGYHTANIGKLHLLPHANRDHREPHPSYGFEHLEISDEPGVYEDAYRAWVRRVAPDQLDCLSFGLPPAAYSWYTTMGARYDFGGPLPFTGDERYTHSAFVAEQTNAFLARQQAGQPFLCIAGFYSPHAPWVVPQRYLDLYDPETFELPELRQATAAERAAAGCSEARLRAARHGYYAMISEVDQYVGRILDQLEQQQLAERTIVVFTSDHGEWLGEHLKYGKGYPGDDLVARVPLIVRWPAGIIAPDRTVSAIVEAVDVLPTLLECAGVQVPPHVQGLSFAAALSDAAFAGRDSALMEHAGWKNLRTARYRYLIHADGSERLWDLECDPRECHDVAGEPAYAPVLAEHRRLLLARLIEQERPLARTWPY
ncbi:MAG TPA: sulfatase-like hydrolase/transferase [Roseiflexaceae bacterium]|nr:sulfatase-like hydrolase/transferase [Roseiflexaceae bacterium]